MHHRRAASDTSMFKRVGGADLKKDASSSHSSRSATPLVNSLLKLGGIFTLHYTIMGHPVLIWVRRLSLKCTGKNPARNNF